MIYWHEQFWLIQRDGVDPPRYRKPHRFRRKRWFRPKRRKLFQAACYQRGLPTNFTFVQHPTIRSAMLAVRPYNETVFVDL